MKLSLFFFIILSIFFIDYSFGLHFYLQEGKSKCFLEDLPRDTVVIVEVDAKDIPENSFIPGSQNEFHRRKNALTEPLGIHGEITLGKEVIASQTIGAKGRFAFTAQDPGEHSICIKTNSSRWFGAGAIKIDVDFQIGISGTNDYEEIKAMEHLSDLEVKIRKLNDKVVDIRREQAYYKYREEHLRDASEMANSNVMWFSFIQTFILVVSGLWQIYHLKSFFKAKKMV